MSGALPRAVVVALARYRQRWGWTLDQLSERTEIPAAALAAFEQGTAVPDTDAAEALVAVLQLDDVAATALRAVAEGLTAESRARPAATGGRFAGWDEHQTCVVTTIGRRSGRPHEHECGLFVVDGDRLFLLDRDGGESRWYRDIESNSGVSVRVTKGRIQTGEAAPLPGGHGDAERARVLATRKYPHERDAIAAAAVAAISSFEVG